MTGKRLLLAGVLCLAAISAAAAQEMKGIDLKDEYLKIPFASGADGKIHDHLNVTKGTIEFWLKLASWTETGPYPIFFWGKRHNATAIYIYKRKVISLALAASNYTTIYSSIALWKNHYDLQPGSWHHVAACWNIENGKEHLAIFLDGKQLDRAEGISHPNRKFSRIPKIPSSLYIGARKKGDEIIPNLPPNITVAQFRISNTVRYDKEFTPQATASLDPHTLLYLPLAENTDGTYFIEGKEPGTVKAERVKVVAE